MALLVLSICLNGRGLSYEILLCSPDETHFLLAELDIVERVVDVALGVAPVIVDAVPADPDLRVARRLQRPQVLLHDLRLAPADVQSLHLQRLDEPADVPHAQLDVLLRPLDADRRHSLQVEDLLRRAQRLVVDDRRLVALLQLGASTNQIPPATPPLQARNQPLQVDDRHLDLPLHDAHLLLQLADHELDQREELLEQLQLRLGPHHR